MTTAQQFYERASRAFAVSKAKPEEVLPHDVFWVEHFEWLKACGYMLRPRYRPGWTPSWEGTNEDYSQFEDGQFRKSDIMDAIRKSDGTMVAMKMCFRSEDADEIAMYSMLQSKPLVSHHKNHCIKILDTLVVPDFADLIIYVMPCLRLYDDPSFLTVGEGVDFCRQLFEGIQFLHENHIAHRDIHRYNVMLDPTELYPEGFHPLAVDKSYNFKKKAKHFTRTERPPKYYLIDYDMAKYYDPALGPPLDMPMIGGDKSAPEFRGEAFKKPQNPFATDIYCAGNLIREQFFRTHTGFSFLFTLMFKMVFDVPRRRPTINEVISNFESLCATQPPSVFRARLIPTYEASSSFYLPLRLYRGVSHVVRDINYRVRRLPPVPNTKIVASDKRSDTLTS